MNFELLNKITSRIKKHHELYDSPIKGEMFEELLNKAFLELGVKNEWKSGSHQISSDMYNDLYGRISCKSGKLNTYKKTNKTTLTLSGSRTTKHKTLEDKIKFLNDKKEDCYFCLSTDPIFTSKYYLLIFNSDILSSDPLTWDTTNSGYKGISDKLEIKIQKSMSDQIWYTLDVDKHKSDIFKHEIIL